MKLAATSYGEARAGATPLVIAHGLFGSAKNLGALARHLAEERRVVAVDMRNHGESPWSDDHSYAAMAGDLAETVESLGGAAHVLGHSMGGKAAMMLALTRPEQVRRLVILDIAPVAYTHSQASLIEAMRAVDLGAVSRRSEADVQLARDIDEPGVRAFLLQSLDLAGHRWRFNLDALDAAMAEITGWPETDARFEGPTLFLSGAASDYVRPDMHARIRRLFPAARFEVLAGCGHWIHAERPREVEAAVESFLAEA